MENAITELDANLRGFLLKIEQPSGCKHCLSQTRKISDHNKITYFKTFHLRQKWDFAFFCKNWALSYYQNKSCGKFFSNLKKRPKPCGLLQDV